MEFKDCNCFSVKLVYWDASFLSILLSEHVRPIGESAKGHVLREYIHTHAKRAHTNSSHVSNSKGTRTTPYSIAATVKLGLSVLRQSFCVTTQRLSVDVSHRPLQQ